MDATYGREVIKKMLAATHQETLLAFADLTESDLLNRWRQFVTAEPEAEPEL